MLHRIQQLNEEEAVQIVSTSKRILDISIGATRQTMLEAVSYKPAIFEMFHEKSADKEVEEVSGICF